MPDAMQRIELPYGDRSVALCLPDDGRVAVYEPAQLPAAPDGEAEVRRAMAAPLGTPPLGAIARAARRVAIVVDDATRPVPTTAMLRPVVDELRRAGVAVEQITVIVATGLHRPMTEAEIDRVRGGLPLKVQNHDARDPAGLVEIGTTSRGTPLRVNRTVAEADLRILTGDVELHQFVGYGGGAKSVLPGICDVEGVAATHAKMDAPGAGPGRLDDNPIRLDIEEAADLLRVDFVLNVVLGARHEIVGAFAGDVHAAFRAGAELVDRVYKVEVPEPVDLAICSPGGYPKDLDLYQSQKAIRAARRIVRRGGTIVALAECREGHGSDLAYAWAREARRPQDIIERHRARFAMGGHKAYQLAADAEWASVYLFSAMPEEVVEAFFIKPIARVGQIESLVAPAGSVAVLPQATLTLPLVEGEQPVGF